MQYLFNEELTRVIMNLLYSRVDSRDQIQLLRIFNAFAKGSYIRSSLEGKEIVCLSEDDLILNPIKGLLGNVIPQEYLKLYVFLKDNYSLKEKDGEFFVPSQEYLSEVYPAFLRSLLPLGRIVFDADFPIPIGYLNPLWDVLKSHGVESVCDLSTNCITRENALSSLLAWSVYENNEGEDPDKYVFYDAIVDYDFLHHDGDPYLSEITYSAQLRANKYAVLLTHLNTPHQDYLDGGMLAHIQRLRPLPVIGTLYFVLFDLKGGHEYVEYPDGKRVFYSEIIKNGGYLI